MIQGRGNLLSVQCPAIVRGKISFVSPEASEDSWLIIRIWQADSTQMTNAANGSLTA